MSTEYTEIQPIVVSTALAERTFFFVKYRCGVLCALEIYT